MRFLGGTIRNVDARYFALGGAAHLAAGAQLAGGRIALSGISGTLDDVRGRLDVFDDGLLTRGLDARVAGLPVHLSGGIYDLRAPRVRMALSGSGDLARLRSAFAQASRLPVHGPIGFALLVEGSARKPVAWIALHSQQMTYAGT